MVRTTRDPPTGAIVPVFSSSAVRRGSSLLARGSPRQSTLLPIICCQVDNIVGVFMVQSTLRQSHDKVGSLASTPCRIPLLAATRWCDGTCDELCPVVVERIGQGSRTHARGHPAEDEPKCLPANTGRSEIRRKPGPADTACMMSSLARRRPRRKGAGSDQEPLSEGEEIGETAGGGAFQGWKRAQRCGDRHSHCVGECTHRDRNATSRRRSCRPWKRLAWSFAARSTGTIAANPMRCHADTGETRTDREPLLPAAW